MGTLLCKTLIVLIHSYLFKQTHINRCT